METEQNIESVRVTYDVIDMAEALERTLPGVYPGDEYDWCWGIWRCENGVPVEFVGQDGGEAEDQCLIRDWRWVAPALQAAYELGRTHSDGDA